MRTLKQKKSHELFLKLKREGYTDEQAYRIKNAIEHGTVKRRKRKKK
jgi:hypothetical protein